MLRALGLGVISASAKRCTTSATTTSNMISCIQRSAAAVGRSPSLGARVLASTSRAAAAPPHLPLLAPNLTSSTASSLSRISRSIVAPGSRAPSSGAALVRPVFTRAAVMSGMRKSPSSLLTRGIGNGSSGQSQVIQIRVPEFLRRPELLFSKRYIKWMLYAGFVFTSFAGMMQRPRASRSSASVVPHTLSIDLDFKTITHLDTLACVLRLLWLVAILIATVPPLFQAANGLFRFMCSVAVVRTPTRAHTHVDAVAR